MNTYKGILLEWLADCSQQLLAVNGKTKNLVVAQWVQEPGCLSSPKLALKSLKIPRDLLVFSMHRNPEEAGLRPAKGHISNSLDELARKSEGKRVKSKSFLLPPSFYIGCRQKVWLILNGGSPQFKRSNQENPSQVSSAAWVLLSSWQSRLAFMLGKTEKKKTQKAPIFSAF